MLRRTFVLLAAASGIAGAAPRAATQSAPVPAAAAVGPRPDLAACSRVAGLMDHTSRELASIEAEGSGDNSAPRATMRELRRLYALEEARMNLDRMIAMHCPDLPDPPTSAPYLVSALKCEGALIGYHGHDLPPECQMRNWKNSFAPESAASAASGAD